MKVKTKDGFEVELLVNDTPCSWVAICPAKKKRVIPCVECPAHGVEECMTYDKVVSWWGSQNPGWEPSE